MTPVLVARRVLVLVVLTCAFASGHAETALRGRVTDAQGRPLRGVTLSFGTRQPLKAVTDQSGTFEVPTLTGAVTLVRVEDYGGEVLLEETLPVTSLEWIVVAPAASEQITVTATLLPERLSESAASIVTLSREAIERSPQLTVDEKLRQVPGFSLFRRTGSRTANPTTQGVSLRGIGPSGTSRALVLDDGFPLNDPFGGWIYWSRVPLLAIERIEVMRGGASDLYGSSAIGGVINLIRRKPVRDGVRLDAVAGSHRTSNASLFGSVNWGEVLLTYGGEWFDTEGFIAVTLDERGTIDVAADSTHHLFEIGLRGTLRGTNLEATVSDFEESRSNGTPLQRNSTSVGEFRGAADWNDSLTHVAIRISALNQEYEQTFSAISGDRAGEALTRAQVVPSSATGVRATWSRLHSPHLSWGAGVEVRRVHATNEETAAGAVTAVSATREEAGLFAEAIASIGERVSLTAGVRGDRFSNENAERRIGAVEERLADRADSALSPRVTLSYRLRQDARLSGSFYRAFRAPTLNELYRSFRVGNVVTLANDELVAEVSEGVEAGVTFGESPRLAIRLFHMTLRDAVSNVTVGSTGGVVTRQRQNVGRTVNRGVEIDATGSWRGYTATLGALFVDARVREFAVDRRLEGLRLPQVPQSQLTGSVAREWASFNAALHARCSSKQFEDDLNVVALNAVCVADAGLELPRGRWSVYAAVENLTNSRVEAGRAPATMLASPRAGRIGVRFSID